MNNKQKNILSKFFNEKIRENVISLEQNFDDYFLKEKNFNKSQYKVLKNIISKVMIEEIIPIAVKRTQDEIIKFTLGKTNTPTKDLELSVRASNVIKAYGITNLEELSLMSLKQFKKLKNVGSKTINELTEQLHNHGLSWAE